VDTQFAHPSPYSNHLAKHFDMWLYVSCTMLNHPTPLPRESKVSTSRNLTWMETQTSLKKKQATVAIASSLATSELDVLRWLRRSARALPLKIMHSGEILAMALELTSTLNAVGRTISRHIAARCRFVYRIIGLKMLNGIHDFQQLGGASIVLPSKVQSHGRSTFVSVPTHECRTWWGQESCLTNAK
jgi:hypothetical protein